MATTTAAAPETDFVPPEVPKGKLAWLLEEIIQQAPGLIKEQEGVIPSHTLAKMWGFAQKIKDAKFLPQHVRGDTASVFFLLSMGQEMGAKWTHALRSLYMTPEGKPGIQGDFALALLQSRNFRVFWPVQEKDRAVCQICRPKCECTFDQKAGGVNCTCGHSGTMEVTYQEMVEAGFVKTKDGSGVKYNWRNPKNMLRWRSFAFCYRFYAADVLGGLYLMEELSDMALAAPEIEAENRMEMVQAAAGAGQPKPDESIIAPEDETAYRATAFAAGKTQAWVAGQIAIVQGEVKAVIALDREADGKLLAKLKLSKLIQDLKQPAGQPTPAPAPRGRRTGLRARTAHEHDADAELAAAAAMERSTGLDAEDVPSDEKRSTIPSTTEPTPAPAPTPTALF